jgi:hypothetical protein
MRIKQRQWVRITPTIYLFPSLVSSYYTHYNDFYDKEYSLKASHGVGLDFDYKYYPTKRGFYCFAGLNYSYFNVDYQYYGFIPYREDGLNYYKYGQVGDNQNFNNIGLFTGLGIQTPMRIGFFIDGHLGFGYQYSFYNKNKASLDDDVFDYGYRGIYPVIEFSLGYAW